MLFKHYNYYKFHVILLLLKLQACVRSLKHILQTAYYNYFNTQVLT